MLPSLLATNPRAYSRRPTSTMSALSWSSETSAMRRLIAAARRAGTLGEQNQAVSSPRDAVSALLGTT